MAPRTATQKPPKPPRKAFLGIDLGTTSLRATLFVPESKCPYDIVNRSSSSGNGRFSEGEYSSTIYPIDGDNPIYNGNVARPDRPSLSAKLSFPSLAIGPSSSNLYQKGYELVLLHLAMLNDDEVRKRARQGIEDLLHVLARDVSRQCDKIKPEVDITAIALSIPAHWTLEFEELYREMIQKTFNKYKVDIFFLTEAEALAHFLYHKRLLPPLEDEKGKGKGNIVLIMDFGGHNTNGCLIDIASSSDDEDSSSCYVGFYHVTKAEDAGGGSEQWEHYIAEECIQMMMDQGFIQSHQNVTPRQRQLLLDDFNRFKKNCEDTSADFEFRCLTLKGRTRPLSLGADKVAAAHEKAFESALQKANFMIKQAAKLSDKKARIIITGGSVRSNFTREKLEKHCQKHGMSEGLRFIADEGVSNLTMRIAHGAAYAIAYQLSVQEFIDRGAAFGMQVREIGPRTPNPKEEPWNDEASLLFLKGEPVHPAPRFSTHGLSEFRIICDPFFKDSDDKVLVHHKCYNFLDLGVLRRGKWSFSIRITDSDGVMMFELTGYGQDHLPGRILVKKSWTFPIYMNIGANAAHLGNPYETPEAIFGNFWEDLRPRKKESAHTTATSGARRKRNSHASSGKCLPSPEMPPAYHTPNEALRQSPAPPIPCPSQEATTHGMDTGLAMEVDAIFKETIIVSPRCNTDRGTSGEFNRSSFTSINQRRRLQDLAAQGDHQMRMLSTEHIMEDPYTNYVFESDEPRGKRKLA
ncbi:hypothetical protein F5Y09DRAFT_277102 [Xylaria sp. FL1042]|nr:hypothetical protein F5Y09DRAFT_277102 [Xylaria sp. FL1042]